MSKAAKAELQAMLSGANGVTVVQEGQKFQVAFGFSNNLVNKIKGVDGAEFNKEAGGVWEVPVNNGAELAAAVADMRDFVLNNGVQVKDVDGGKQVIFDYNKEMTQVIGAVAGAKFDQEGRVWNVPGDSKALAVGAEQNSSYFDMAINKMRGIAIETAKDYEEILAMTNATATERGFTPGIVFPDKDHSYQGEILRVNGHYAAQKTGEKEGVGFVTIHTLADLGKPVFKGDDMRIDYDKTRQVSVRTTAVFEQQKGEREQLNKIATGLADNAEVMNASTKDKTKYTGVVKGVTEHFVLQSVGRNEFKIHARENLDNNQLAKDQNLEISYKDGKGAVVDLAKKKEQAQGVAR